MGRCQRRPSAPNSLEKFHQPGLVSTLVLACFFAGVLDFGCTLVSKANSPCLLTTEALLHSPQSFQDALSSAMKSKGTHGHFPVPTIPHKDVNAKKLEQLPHKDVNARKLEQLLFAFTSTELQERQTRKWVQG